MAGTVRKRIRANRQGELQTTWFADYYDQHGQRRRKFFATKRAADDWLDNTRIEVKAGIHTPDANGIIVKEAARLWLQAACRGGCPYRAAERA